MAKILIVEDDPYVLRFYDRLFKLGGYEFEMAKDGKEGIAKAKTFKPSLILLDIMMPKMNGMEVLKLLKADPATKDCSVIMLTNLSDTSSVKEATRLGADGFIIKSDTSPGKLLENVNQYLQKH